MIACDCYCEDSIPPWSVFWAKSLMNPSPFETPILVVTRPGVSVRDDDSDKTDALNDRDVELSLPTAAFEFYTPPPIYKEFFYATNFKANIFTNGMLAIRAKNIFAAIPLTVGIHWLRYDEDRADPEHRLFFPRDDTWYLGSMASETTGSEREAYGQSRGTLAHRVHGVVFRRVGIADTIHKCVPVIMTVANFQVDDALSVA